MASIHSHVRTILRILITRLTHVWKRYRSLRPRTQIIIAVVVGVLLIALLVLGGGTKAPETTSTVRTVTLQSVGTLSNAGPAGSVLGTVRSVTEAELLAQSGGTVTSVNVKVGTSVGAGSVLAELDNGAQRAAVLQAEGAYDAAVASRASVSPVDAEASARNAYRSAYANLDTVLNSQIDTFFGPPTPRGPALLVNSIAVDPDTISRARAAINDSMKLWRNNLAVADSKNAEALLTEAGTVARDVQSLTEMLAKVANENNADASATQQAALVAARASVSGIVTSISGALAGYRSNSTTSTASVDAGVKAALGTLRLAQTNLERTIVRAPISGTVNFLPIRVGDYVTPLMHVATVAQNGALEIVAFVSEDVRAGLAVGMTVSMEGTQGVITSIAPALDPVNKQIEIHIAVNGANTLVNGQSVRITLPSSVAVINMTATSTGPTMLPLAAVKLTATNRVVFTIGEASTLVALPVTIGDVRGDRIEITSPLPATTMIVTDARGLAEGQTVKIATP